METIIAAAIKVKNPHYEDFDLVISAPPPSRHFHLLHGYHDLLKTTHATGVNRADQGFLTSTGRYVDRKEAMIIAREANQTFIAEFNDVDLFSENLW